MNALLMNSLIVFRERVVHDWKQNALVLPNLGFTYALFLRDFVFCLQLMDGFDQTINMTVIMTTNRVDIL